jgi:hypothetical protein
MRNYNRGASVMNSDSAFAFGCCANDVIADVAVFNKVSNEVS